MGDVDRGHARARQPAQAGTGGSRHVAEPKDDPQRRHGAPSTGNPSAAGTSTTSSGSPFAAVLAQAASGYSPGAPAGQLEDPSAYPGTGLPSTVGLPGTVGLPSGRLPGITGLSGVAGASDLGYPSDMQGVGSSTLSSGGHGGRIVALAETQVGQSEQPPGSNESPAIAQYRTATAGAIPGAPWCAYFASWAAQQAGEPLGPQGQGLGSVSEIWSWAQGSGRAMPNGPGVVPPPGDLIMFGDSHVGIVKEVLSGQIATIEGNYENKVAANVRSPGEATGDLNMS